MLAFCVAVTAAACGSTPTRRPPPEDRTLDPELQAALEAVAREFETQADALTAGIYEGFTDPDSVRAVMPVTTIGGGQAAVDVAGDPSTEALLGTLEAPVAYNPPVDEVTGSAGPVDETWTLQMGAFATEPRALVRIRQLERDFPDVSRWYALSGGVFRVYIGRYQDRLEAERARERVVEGGYPDAWVARAP